MQLQVILKSDDLFDIYLSNGRNTSVFGVRSLSTTYLEKNTREIIELNSKLSKLISDLAVVDDDLRNIKYRFLSLFENIYRSQYNKLKVLSQLKIETDSTISSWLKGEYQRFDNQNEDFVDEYQKIVQDFNQVCLITENP